jgi:hypothetical protein
MWNLPERALPLVTALHLSELHHGITFHYWQSVNQMESAAKMIMFQTQQRYDC